MPVKTRTLKIIQLLFYGVGRPNIWPFELYQYQSIQIFSGLGEELYKYQRIQIYRGLGEELYQYPRIQISRGLGEDVNLAAD